MPSAEPSRALAAERDALRGALDRLTHADQIKNEVILSVTHELRTPLSSIRALAELMRDAPDMPAAQREAFLNIVIGEAERLSRMVNQVLDMARIESGHAQWRDAAIDMRALLQRAAASMTALFHERGAAVELQLPHAVPNVRTDADRVQQVVLNLLSNALKHVPRGQGRVRVHLASDASGVTVQVHDNGPGVPAALQPQVFEPFTHADSDASPHQPQGTGLGLSISRQIVEHLGGRIWLVSEPGQGACFGFSLPWTHKAAGDAFAWRSPSQDKETHHEQKSAHRR